MAPASNRRQRRSPSADRQSGSMSGPARPGNRGHRAECTLQGVSGIWGAGRGRSLPAGWGSVAAAALPTGRGPIKGRAQAGKGPLRELWGVAKGRHQIAWTSGRGAGLGRGGAGVDGLESVPLRTPRAAGVAPGPATGHGRADRGVRESGCLAVKAPPGPAFLRARGGPGPQRKCSRMFGVDV